MALTLNNFWGAETGGLEEVARSVGSSASASAAKSGDYGYFQSSPTDEIGLDPFESIASAGTKTIIGLWWRTTSVSSQGSIFSLWDGTTTDLTVGLNSSEKFILSAGGSGQAIISTDAAVADQWYYIELYVDLVDSGSAELFIDGVSAGTTSGQDFNRSSGSRELMLLNLDAAPAYHDDIYFMSGATDADDRLGGAEVFAYRGGGFDTADWIKGSDGDLNGGSWTSVQEIPFDEGNWGRYDDTTARAGGVDTDTAGLRGPNSDIRIDGDSNIVAMKGIWRMKRSGGSGSVHYGLMGNTGSAIVDGDRTVDFDPSTSYENYFDVREDNLPLSTEYGRIGFEKDNKGQDFDCAEMLFQILHVPAQVAGASLIYNPMRPMMPHLAR